MRTHVEGGDVGDPQARIDPESLAPKGQGDDADLRELLGSRWGSPIIITRARTHDATTLPGYVYREGGRLMGLITLSIQGRDCEVVTIDAVEQGRGIGSAMLARAERHARAAGCDRMWLVTTNDNLRALYFYQIRGFRLIAVHRDAVLHSREIKPEIPACAPNGIAILDEIELEKEI